MRAEAVEVEAGVAALLLLQRPLRTHAALMLPGAACVCLED